MNLYRNRYSNKYKIIKNKAQIALEYFLFLAAVILIIIFILGKKNAPIQKGVEKYVDDLGDRVAERIPNN